MNPRRRCMPEPRRTDRQSRGTDRPIDQRLVFGTLATSRPTRWNGRRRTPKNSVRCTAWAANRRSRDVTGCCCCCYCDTVFEPPRCLEFHAVRNSSIALRWLVGRRALFIRYCVSRYGFPPNRLESQTEISINQPVRSGSMSVEMSVKTPRTL